MLRPPTSAVWQGHNAFARPATEEVWLSCPVSPGSVGKPDLEIMVVGDLAVGAAGWAS